MARTVQNLIDEIKSNRFPWMTTAEGLQYANDVHKEIIGMMPPMRRMAFSAPVSVAITAGTREYVLPLTTNQIERAEFTPTGGATIRLNDTSIETIDRGMSAGHPRRSVVP